jgi:hypothetical protein
MAVGDSSRAVGYPLVDLTTGKVKDGGTEINTTRDLVADLKISVDARFTGKITRGTATPVNTSGSDGDIYLKMV